MELSRRRLDDPDFDEPISPEIGASTDRAAKVRPRSFRPVLTPAQKLVSERNAAVAASTLLVYFVLWRTFAREIELHRLHEKIAKVRYQASRLTLMAHSSRAARTSTTASSSRTACASTTRSPSRVRVPPAVSPSLICVQRASVASLAPRAWTAMRPRPRANFDRQKPRTLFRHAPMHHDLNDEHAASRTSRSVGGRP